MLPVPTVTELEVFTGRPQASFGPFAVSALSQATLLFTVVTRLQAYPDDPDLSLLAHYAILEMADRLLLEQPYQEIRTGPFQTETIGSYSYSKVTQAARDGLKTGLWWWDLALDQLTVVGAGGVAHGSIKVVQEGLVATDEGWELRNPDIDEATEPLYIRIS